MLVPALIVVACFGAGAAASARYLPDLGPGRVGGIAFFLVCGLLGAALGLIGLHLYTLAHGLERGRGFGLGDDELFADVVRNILFEAGSLVALAAIVYLLAPQLSKTAPISPVASTRSEDVEQVAQ